MSEFREPTLTPVELILFDVLEQGGGEAALESACQKNPEFESDLRTRYAVLGGHGLLGQAGPGTGEVQKQIGEFTLLRVLGGGGMGVVHAARQESTGREVALKLIRPEHLWFPGRRERFRREAQALAKLDHPGIAQVYAVGEENGIPFLAQELVSGQTLAERLRAVRGRDVTKLAGTDFGVSAFAGSWLQACIRITRDVAHALQHAHERGVLHRDIKPSNVMLSADGRVVLIDFGLARAVEAESMTQTGAAPGSLPYMAPETIAGDRVGYDPRLDVYATGVLFYELATLMPAFADARAERLRSKVLAGNLVAPRKLNPAISRDAEVVCLRAIDVDAKRRYAAMADLVRDLEHLLALEPIVARPTSATTRALRAMKRRPWKTAGVAVGLATVLGIAIPFWWIRGHADVLAVGHNAQLTERYEEALAEAMRLYDANDPRGGDEALDLAESVGVGGGETTAYRVFGQLQRQRPESALALARSLSGSERRAVASLEAHALTMLGRQSESDALRAALPAPTTPAELFWAGIDLYFTNNNAIERGSSSPANELRAYDLISRSMALAPRPRLIQACYRLAAAVTVRDARSIRESIEVLEQTWPNSAIAWYWIGNAKTGFDRLGAINAYERSMRLQPMREDAHYRFCDLLLRHAKIESAEAGITRFQKCFPASVFAWTCLSQLEARKGRLPQALAAAQHAVEIDPNCANAHCTIASHATALEHYELAHTHARKAILLEPGNATAQVQLGDTLFYLKRPDEGVLAARKGIALIEKTVNFPQANEALSRLVLARLLIARGDDSDRHEARNLVAAAVGVDPRGAATHAFAVNLLRKMRDRDGLQAEENRYTTATRPTSGPGSASRPSSR